jgi:hypothetical protein
MYWATRLAFRGFSAIPSCATDRLKPSTGSIARTLLEENIFLYNRKSSEFNKKTYY